jgi:hypothetical protein
MANTPYYTKAETDALDQQLKTLLGTGYKGTIPADGNTPTTEPAPTDDGLYFPKTNGTYTNFGGLVVDLSNTFTAISVEQGQTNFELIEIPISLTIDAVPTDGSTNAVSGDGIVKYSKLTEEVKSLNYQKNKNLFTGGVWGEYVKEPAKPSGQGIGYATNYARALLIEVEELTSYTMSGNPYKNSAPLLCFDENLKELGLVDSKTATNTTLSDTKYVSFTVAFNNAIANFSALQFEKGTAATPYEKNISIATNVNSLKISEENILGVDLRKSNGNDFLLRDVVWGKFVREPENILGNNIGTAANYATTGFIKVEQGETYTMSGNPYKNSAPLLCFDETLKEVDYLITNTVAIPNGVNYVKFTIAFNNANVDFSDLKFIKSSKTTPTLQSDQFSGITLRSRYENKRITWTGTSIPATAYSGGWNYPTIIQEMLGCKMNNTSLSGAPLRISKVDGSNSAVVDYFTKNFTRTKDEIQSFFDSLGGYTQPQIDAFKLNSYEEKLIPNAFDDLIIFDWSVNDFSLDSTDFNTPITDFSTRDRRYYVGAFNYAIEKLLEANPRARFAIVSHWRPNFMANHILIQKQIAEYWSCPFIDLSNTLGWSGRIIQSTGDPVYTPFAPDGTHPHTDTTGNSIWIYAKVLSEWIKTIY